MAVFNGTALLLYSEGVLVGFQQGLTINVSQKLEDITNKESAGWEQHISGVLNATIEFNALFASPNTPDMNALALMDYIINRESLLVEILGLTYPFVGEADLSSLKFNAPLEGAMSLSGSLKTNGGLYMLSSLVPVGAGNMANLITDPDAGGTDYDTLTVSGLKITSAINAAGNAYCDSNTITTTNGAVYKVACFLTKTSGQLPTVGLYDKTSAYISNTKALVEGLNFITLTGTATDASSCLRFSNSGAASWHVSNIYLFRTA
jgi:predicted secreted protein